MKIHTTQGGDQFLIDHIESTTSWSQRNRPRTPRLFTICGSFALAAIVFLTLLIVL